jgi:GT2 family glycosyltransferase
MNRSRKLAGVMQLLLRGHLMKAVLRRMLDESEFLSDYGVRAISRYHLTRLFENLFDNRRMSRTPPISVVSRKTPISVVINTYNRAAALAKTLEALRRQTYPEFEVVVVNGPSTDATNAILSQFAPDVKIACCPDRKLGVSRNIGINIAAGDIVAFIDDDAVPEITWLEKLAIAYADPLVAAAGGYVFDVPTGRVLWRICTCTRVADDVSHDAAPPADRYLGQGADPFLFLCGCNMSFRRSALMAIGGFNEAIVYGYDDVDVCRRIIDKGGKITVLENAIVYHERAPSTVRDDGLAIRDCYPLIHSFAIFLLQGRSHGTSVRNLISRIKGFANYWEKAASHRMDQGTFTPVEYARFVQRIDDAVRDGITEGLRPRTFRKFEPPCRTAFHPYPAM